MSLLFQYQSKVISDRKAVVTLASVVLAFAVCWVPYFLAFVIKPFLGYTINYHADLVALWLGYANSSVNPFLYAFHSTAFRDGFRRVLCRHCGFRLSSVCCRPWRRNVRNGGGRVGRLRGRRLTASGRSRSSSLAAPPVDVARSSRENDRTNTCQQLFVAGLAAGADDDVPPVRAAELCACREECCMDRTATSLTLSAWPTDSSLGDNLTGTVDDDLTSDSRTV
jgi:hypothetical protein